MKKLIVIVILALFPMGQLFSQIYADTSDLRPYVSVSADGVVPCVPNNIFILFGYITHDTTEFSCRQKLNVMVSQCFELLRKNGIDSSLFVITNFVEEAPRSLDDRLSVTDSLENNPASCYIGGSLISSEGIYNKDFLTRVHGTVSKVPDILTFEARFLPTEEQDDSLMNLATAKAIENARREAEQLAGLSNSKIIGVKRIVKGAQKSYHNDFSSGNGYNFGSIAARDGAEITLSPKPINYSQRVYIDYYIESK